MAINPIRIGQLDLPPNPHPVPFKFTGLQELGEGIGRWSDQREVGKILAGAIGPDGNLDVNKAAAGIAASGRDPSKYLSAAYNNASLAATVAYHAASLKQAQEQNAAQREQHRADQAAAQARFDAQMKLQREQFEQGKFIKQI